MVDSFNFQNISSPREPSSVAKRYKTEGGLLIEAIYHMYVLRTRTNKGLGTIMWKVLYGVIL